MSGTNSRAEVFASLASFSEMIPEMRAGQLVAAIGELCADLHGRGLWDAEDSELLEAVWQFQRNFENAASAASAQPAEPPAEAERGRQFGSPGPTSSEAAPAA